MQRRVWIAPLLATLSWGAVSAEYKVFALRCGTGLIKAGDSKSKLIRACGKADSVTSAGSSVKEYSYQSGRKPLTVVTVKSGVVTTIVQHR